METATEVPPVLHPHLSTRTGSEGGRFGPTGEPVLVADTEVIITPKRRRHTMAYKLEVIARVADLKQNDPKAIGEYLRSEGLYYADVKKWKHAHQEGELSEHRKGTIGFVKESMSKENAKLKRHIASLEKKLEQAELLVDLQKKVSQLFQNDMAIRRQDRSLSSL